MKKILLLLGMCILMASLVFGLTGEVETFLGYQNPYNIFMSYSNNTGVDLLNISYYISCSGACTTSYQYYNYTKPLGDLGYRYAQGVDTYYNDLPDSCFISPIQIYRYWDNTQLTKIACYNEVTWEILAQAEGGLGDDPVNFETVYRKKHINITHIDIPIYSYVDTFNINITHGLSSVINDCFQDFTNESSGCGDIAGDNYSISASWIDGTLTYDGDYNTYGRANGNIYVSLSLNYTIPNNVSQIIWQVKDGTGTYNITIPDKCIHDDKIFFEIVSAGILNQVWWSCFNETLVNDKLYTSSGTTHVYEESIFWDFIDPDYSETIKDLSIIVNNISHYNEGVLNDSTIVFMNTSLINNILDDRCNCLNCSLVNDICTIPINFENFAQSILNISLTNISYTYGISDCNTEYNHTILNLTYFDENTISPIQVSNTYELSISDPFSQSIYGSVSNSYTNSYCSNINLTKRELTYDLYGIFTVSKDGYSTRIIENDNFNPYTVESSPYYDLPIYLIDITNSSEVEFTVSDSLFKTPLEGVQTLMYQTINGSQLLVESKLTSIIGKVKFEYLEDRLYYFKFLKLGYNSSEFNLNPIESSTYDVFMFSLITQTATQPYNRISIDYTPKTFGEDLNNNFSISFNSPYDELISYNYTLTYPGGISQGAGNEIYGESFSETINIVGAGQFDTATLDLYFDTDLTGVKYYRYYIPIIATAGNYTISGQSDPTYGMGLLERLIIAVFIALMFAGISSLMGQDLPGMFISFCILGYLAYIDFIPAWSIYLSMVIGFVFISARSE